MLLAKIVWFVTDYDSFNSLEPEAKIVWFVTDYNSFNSLEPGVLLFKFSNEQGDLHSLRDDSGHNLESPQT